MLISLCSVCTAEDTDTTLGPATRQAALLALSQVGQHVGQTNPQAVMAVLPSIVAAVKDVHRSVRSSALAAAAACLVALGSAVLPLLPSLVPAILAAAQAAVHGLPEKVSSVVHYNVLCCCVVIADVGHDCLCFLLRSIVWVCCEPAKARLYYCLRDLDQQG